MSEYADRDVIKLGKYYTRHVEAMTSEGLHEKSDIAAELAWRDLELERLREILHGRDEQYGRWAATKNNTADQQEEEIERLEKERDEARRLQLKMESDFDEVYGQKHSLQIENARLRERVEELMNLVAAKEHFHKAGDNGDICDLCGMDLRHSIHRRCDD